MSVWYHTPLPRGIRRPASVTAVALAYLRAVVDARPGTRITAWLALYGIDDSTTWAALQALVASGLVARISRTYWRAL